MQERLYLSIGTLVTVKALAADPQAALEQWAAALDAVMALVRGKDLAR